MRKLLDKLLGKEKKKEERKIDSVSKSVSQKTNQSVMKGSPQTKVIRNPGELIIEKIYPGGTMATGEVRYNNRVIRTVRLKYPKDYQKFIFRILSLDDLNKKMEKYWEGKKIIELTSEDGGLTYKGRNLVTGIEITERMLSVNGPIAEIELKYGDFTIQKWKQTIEEGGTTLTIDYPQEFKRIIIYFPFLGSAPQKIEVYRGEDKISELTSDDGGLTYQGKNLVTEEETTWRMSCVGLSLPLEGESIDGVLFQEITSLGVIKEEKSNPNLNS